MPTPLPFMRNFWIVFIAVSALNAALQWVRSRSDVEDHPERDAGYRRLIRGWLIYGNIPWAIMACGNLFGGTTSPWDILDPRNGVWVVAFWASVVVLSIAAARWIYFRGGAEDLAEHPALVSGASARQIKRMFGLMLAGGAMAFVMIALTSIRTR